MLTPITSHFVEAAHALRERGFAIVWLCAGKKSPRRGGWTKSSQDPGDGCPGDNLGVLCGRPSGDIVCIDLDMPGSAELARAMLPATGMVDGRPGNPASHWWYRVTDVPPELEARPNVAGGIGGPRSTIFKGKVSDKSVVEFKGTGTQAVVPPSLWNGGGPRETRTWCDGDGRPVATPGEPATVDCRQLFDRVYELARALGARPAGWVEAVMNPKAPRPGRTRRVQNAPGTAIVAEAPPRQGADPRAGVLLIPLPDRLDVARVAVGRIPVARSGHGGHATTFRAARTLVNDCALPREPALELLRAYNDRLRDAGEEAWTEEELAHKIDSALTAAPDPRFPYGGKVLAEPVTNPHRLAHEFLAGTMVRYWRDLYWEYDGRKYLLVADREMRALLTGHIERRFAEVYAAQGARYARQLEAWEADPKGQRPAPPALMPVKAALLRDVTLALDDLALLRGTFSMPCLLPTGGEPALLAVANGLLDLNNRVLIPHTRDWFSNVCVPYPYDPAAVAPQWLAFLERNLDGDPERIRLLQEFFGYCLVKTTDAQACLILTGAGGNGKSVVLAVLRGTLGADNVATVPLEHFGQRFALAQTLGKLANLCAEVGEIDRTAEGTLKSYVSGDPMFFERKGKDGFSAPPTARLVIATNNVPRFADRSQGIWRRLLLMPMDVEIPPEERRAGMDKEEYWERAGELPGVLNWALEGLRRLRDRGWQFTLPEACRVALDDHRRESDPARTFLLDHYEADAAAVPIPAEELYQAYQL
jgi:P4 family phage/plasmid primase-like protien